MHTASSADTLHHLEYTAFDAFGNLTQQQNTLTGLTESFHYDKLHRLTGNTVTYGGQTVQQIDYAWDAVGNLQKKTDYSADRPDAYTYHTRQPNAVATVLKPDNTTVSFSYDARGNLTTGDSMTATYNTWDKPTRLTRSKQGISTTMAFTYSADLMRYKQVRTTDGISSTTYYIDKLYEETHTAGRTEWKAYISEVAVVGETQQQGRYIAFTHKDRLGSGTTFTDHHGQVTALRTFDPFGKPRGNDGASLSNTTLDNLDQSRRGFTDHEHLDEIDIIHMKTTPEISVREFDLQSVSTEDKVKDDRPKRYSFKVVRKFGRLD